MNYKTILILFMLLSCSKGINTNYNDFKSKYGTLSNYNLDKEICIQDFLDSGELIEIDTQYLDKYFLIDKSRSNEEGIGLANLKDYNCKLIGIYNHKGFDCIVTTSYTTQAGDGNMILLINTYKKTGQIIDSTKLDILFRHDYEIDPKQYFNISNELKIKFKTIYNHYQQIDSTTTSQLLLTHSDSILNLMQINSKGIIINN